MTLFILMVFPVSAQVTEKGPYTVTQLQPNVFRIEDSNKSNPAGNHFDASGKPVVNNCSDMYLIVGRDKALLIDLSNFITWDTTAVTSLRSIVYGAKGDRALYITGTHRHGDHTGMLPAFKNDEKVKFWIQTAEYANLNLFPEEKVIDVAGIPSLDLGGSYVVDAMELPGHTDHSTVFFLRGKNILFTGDGIGSGHGVWIFSYDGFLKYKVSVDNLIAYIADPVHKIDAKELLVYPGHYWQKREKENLPMQYILDMRTLIEKIKGGNTDEHQVSFNSYLNREYTYGMATITWNKADQLKYTASE
jgi:glyoxylase-like metal-dependent hydrolase (beta-lactamase superfamily II)